MEKMNIAGLYIIEKNQRVWRWGRKSKGEKEKKENLRGNIAFDSTKS